MPRAKAQTSLDKIQLQLAIALSSSLEESKTRELSKLAEELPADAIEDGAIPQNIKQMQKEFLERLQPKPATAPARRVRKVVIASVPTLLSRSSDERLRIITEKVALVLIKDDSEIDYPQYQATKEVARDECHKENVLWHMSCVLVPEEEKQSYYIDKLSAFVMPNATMTSHKFRSLAQLPGTLKTPVKCKPLPTDTSVVEEMSNQDLDATLQHCFNIQQFVPDGKNQDVETLTELQNDWQRMVNNPGLSDVTISTKGKATIFAHKFVFFVRCPAILNDVKNGNVLIWNNVSYKEALAFVEFVYCGQLEATRVLQQHVSGVALLARRFNVTELLKLIMAYDTNAIENSVCDETIKTCVNAPEEDVLNGNISADMFADQDFEDEMPSLALSQRTSVMAECHEPINLDSDEDDLLVQDFFGTRNPTVSSPILSSSFPSTSQSVFTHSPPIGMSSSQQFKNGKQKSSAVRKILTSAVSSVDCIAKYENDPLSDECTFVCNINTEEVDKTSTFSPLKRSSQSALRMSDPISQGCALVDDRDRTCLTQRSKSTEHPVDNKELDIDDHIEISSDDDIVPSSQDSPRKSANTLFLKSLPHGSQRLVLPRSSQDAQRDLQVIDVDVDSSFISKRKLESKEDLEKNASYTSKKICMESSIEVSPQISNAPIEISSAESAANPSSFGLKTERFSASSTSRQLFQVDEDLFEDSFNLNTTWSNLNDNIQPTDDKPLDQSVESCLDQYLVTPKMQRITSLIKDSAHDFKKLLDDSFVCDVNDSVLLRDAKGIQTPEQQPTMIFDTPLRTPLDDIKTSSPVTPMPDYSVMSNERFEEELLRFGLKRSLSRNKGIKMLKYIYGKMHPLVEVVNLRGKELFIPIGEKSPASVAAAAARLPPAPLPQDPDEDNEPYTQQSSSSDEDCVVQEETMFLEEEHCSPEAFSDLKTGVKKWIASKPDLHERILRYEPIWLESVHMELKEYLKVKFKVNQLMDVLDEEGITFRMGAQATRNTRRKKSPRKKASQAKKKALI